jgi:tetratricopeptide (TPR) repeat protein
VAYASARKYDEAIADFTKAIELDPEHEDAYRQRAYIYYHYTEQYRAALADYTRSMNWIQAHLMIQLA